ncbi:uncharacterized protein QC763_710700 [Podospora pseudopauciseta]|uniref:DUF4484 domain-containing protein n=1 Tax=Podospora pseudopauciseta TaxID=2093780 RepID=A0ABR0H243_9PEZI|nr:hypothetical protein QC763_710700 [Podospora pseudopauciseta]
MAESRRGHPNLSVRLPQPGASVALPDLPPVSALFLIDFDVKAGYTIVWKRAVPGLELEGAVEYKSLPSGLHTVTDDLIYFVHDASHAGLSAFINTPTDEEETRHARMIAVGVLVPLSYGRLGRAWRHAEGLKEMASKLVQDRKQTQILEEYWERNGARETSAPQPLKDEPLASPALSFRAVRPPLGRGHTRNRSASDGTALIPPGHRLSPYHPAWSLTSLLDTFGPLIFPVHRAALLRKRILISCHAPVHEVCNFVYDISVLSNIPLSVCDVIDPSAPVQRLRPLFTIGVHDISYLMEHQAAMKKRPNQDDQHSDPSEDSTSGWVACTTDSILAMKGDLWDMLITLPPVYSSNAKERAWPTIECPKGVPVKATQRDLRRFRTLRAGLAHLAAAAEASHSASQPQPEVQTPDEAPTPSAPAIRLSKPAATSSSSRPGTSSGNHPRQAMIISDEDADQIVEPTTWAALAYNGFMWWASAGEKRHSDEIDEQSHDASLLADLGPPMSPSMTAVPQRRPSFGTAVSGTMIDSLSSLTARKPGEDAEEDDEKAGVELAIIAYFHRLTTGILRVLAEIVDSGDDDDLMSLDLDYGETPGGGGGGREGEGEDERERLLGGESDDYQEEGYEGRGGGWVRVDSDALAQMGLDVWSLGDAEFVREVVGRYFEGKRAAVVTKGVEVCGVKVC